MKIDISDDYRSAFAEQIAYLDSLPPAWRADLLMFTDNASQEFYNKFLCGGSPWLQPDVWAQIPTLHAAFRNIPPLRDPVVVWRGLSTRKVDLPRMGCQLVSTSLDRDVAFSFAAWPTGAVIKLTLPAGLRVLPLATITWTYTGESEVLLPAGQWHIVEPATPAGITTAAFTPADVNLDIRLPPEPPIQRAYRFEYAEQLRFVYRYLHKDGYDAMQKFIKAILHIPTSIPHVFVEQFFRRLPLLDSDHILYTTDVSLHPPAGQYLIASVRRQTVAAGRLPGASNIHHAGAIVKLAVPAGARVLPLAPFTDLDDGLVLLRPGSTRSSRGFVVYEPAPDEAGLVPSNHNFNYARPYVKGNLWNVAHELRADEVLQFIFDMAEHGNDHAVRDAMTVLANMFDAGAEVPAEGMWEAGTSRYLPELLELLLQYAPSDIGREYGETHDRENLATYVTNVWRVGGSSPIPE